MKRLLLALCAIAALGIGWAFAQQVVIQGQLNGTEAWQVGLGGPAGPGVYTNVSGVRNGETYALINAGTTITTNVSPNVSRIIVTGAITTLNLSLPTTPFDGQRVIVSCPGGNVTTLTVSSNTVNGVAYPASTIPGSVSACNVSPSTSMAIVYEFTAPTSWWRVQ